MRKTIFLICRVVVLVFIIIKLSTNLTYADIINIPADQLTIQEGINVSVNGDTILVQPGTYVENINYNGKNIVVASLFLTTQDTSYISQTIIDGDSCGSVVTYENGEDSTAILTGFTITNGYSNDGGGIYCDGSNPSFENVTITSNSAFSLGGGIYFWSSSSPSLLNVTVTDNSAGFHGGGICCYFSSPSLINVTITGNFADDEGGGIYCGSICSPCLENVTITDNSADFGGGISCYGSSPNFVNVTITDNYAEHLGGGIYCHNSSTPILINCILWNDSPQEIYMTSGSVFVTYSNIQGGWTGEGNIDADPLFVDPDNGDYHLSWINYPVSDSTKSSCIDAGNPDPQYNDPDGTRNDMGAYPYYQNIPPIISSITDVPDDQGHYVIVTWLRSCYDELGSIIPIVGYNLWEMYPFNLEQNNITNDITKAIISPQIFLSHDDTIWIHIDYIAAMQWVEYSSLAETFVDSTSSGNYMSYFFVSAHTTDPLVYYCSPIDSGYSVDNLAPSPPQGFNGAIIGNQVELYWQPCPDEDFQYFALYKSNESGNYPDEPYATTIDTFYIDTNITYDPIYYVLTAFDYIGNESEYSEELLVTLTDIDDNISYIPEHYSISQNHPNPFKKITSFSYEIPESGVIRLNIYNLKGQLVEILINENKSVGYHTVEWNIPEKSVISSGIYFYKLITKDKTLIKKMVLMR